MTTIPRQFAIQLTAKLIPALIQDGFVQPGFVPVALSALVTSLKGVSSRLVRKTMMTSLQRQSSAACYFLATPDDTWRISLMMSAAITNAPPASPRHPSISFSNSHPNSAANTGSIA
jgi:hypothetical protein